MLFVMMIVTRWCPWQPAAIVRGPRPTLIVHGGGRAPIQAEGLVAAPGSSAASGGVWLAADGRALAGGRPCTGRPSPARPRGPLLTEAGTYLDGRVHHGRRSPRAVAGVLPAWPQIRNHPGRPRVGRWQGRPTMVDTRSRAPPAVERGAVSGSCYLPSARAWTRRLRRSAHVWRRCARSSHPVAEGCIDRGCRGLCRDRRAAGPTRRSVVYSRAAARRSSASCWPGAHAPLPQGGASPTTRPEVCRLPACLRRARRGRVDPRPGPSSMVLMPVGWMSPALAEPRVPLDATPPASLDVAEPRASGCAAPHLRDPRPYSLTLSELSGSTCYLKLENLHMTGSFKERWRPPRRGGARRRRAAAGGWRRRAP